MPFSKTKSIRIALKNFSPTHKYKRSTFNVLARKVSQASSRMCDNRFQFFFLFARLLRMCANGFNTHNTSDVFLSWKFSIGNYGMNFFSAYRLFHVFRLFEYKHAALLYTGKWFVSGIFFIGRWPWCDDVALRILFFASLEFVVALFLCGAPSAMHVFCRLTEFFNSIRLDFSAEILLHTQFFNFSFFFKSFLFHFMAVLEKKSTFLKFSSSPLFFGASVKET